MSLQLKVPNWDEGGGKEEGTGNSRAGTEEKERPGAAVVLLGKRARKK